MTANRSSDEVSVLPGNGDGSFGAASVFLAGDGPVRAQAHIAEAPVQPWVRSHSSSGFAAELVASHPAGTGRVRAELEACPPGVAFGDPECATALTPSWVTVDGTTPEAVISHPFTDLTSDAALLAELARRGGHAS